MCCLPVGGRSSLCHACHTSGRWCGGSRVSAIRYRSMLRRFQFSQKEGVAVSRVDGQGLGWARSRQRPTWYTGLHVQGRFTPPPQGFHLSDRLYPRLIMAIE